MCPGADWQTAFVTSVVNTAARKPRGFGDTGGATYARPMIWRQLMEDRSILSRMWAYGVGLVVGLVLVSLPVVDWSRYITYSMNRDTTGRQGRLDAGRVSGVSLDF